MQIRRKFLPETALLLFLRGELWYNELFLKNLREGLIMNRKKTSAPMPKGFGLLIVSIILLSAIPKDNVRRVWMLLLRKPEALLNRPQEMAIFLAFVVLVLLAVIAVIAVFAGLLRKKPAEREKPNPSARRDSNPRGIFRELMVNEMKVNEQEAIHCGHLTGREKYMEQINSFLKNGLIDRSEYNALRERYSKLDIPDDYHG